MKREDYLAHTKIEDEEEAQSIMTKLKVLFVVVFVSGIIVRALDVVSEVNDDLLFDVYDTVGPIVILALYATFIALLIYFTWYCRKVLIMENNKKISWLFSFIFAPISWFWFYPAIMDPLKIIVGDKEPPEVFEKKSELTPEEEKKKKKKNQVVLWVFLAGLALFIAMIVALAVLVEESDVDTSSSATSYSAARGLYNDPYKLDSSDHNFKATFPNFPIRTTDEIDYGDGDFADNVTYASESEGVIYMVDIIDQSSFLVPEDFETIDLPYLYKGIVEEALADVEDSKLITLNDVTFQEYDALEYVVNMDGMRVRGMLFFADMRLFDVFIAHDPEEVHDKEYDFFIKSFSLTE